MHHVTAVGVAQRVRHLAGDRERLVEWELPLTPQATAQRLAFDVRHDVIEETGCLARIVQRKDMGVLQLSRQPDLAQEPFGTQGRGELGTEDLQRNLTVVARVAGQVDRRRPAVADLVDQLVGTDLLPLEVFLRTGGRGSWQGGCDEAIASLVGGEQRLDLGPQRFVGATRFAQKRAPLTGITLESRQEQLFSPVPVRRLHRGSLVGFPATTRPWPWSIRA